MNYGFAPSAALAPVQLSSAEEADRLCIQLYAHAIEETDLRGKDVLEVGSGRGGGASYVHRHRLPASTTGVDFSRAAVAFCSKRHQVHGLKFVPGDALSLPFDDNTFDAVLNIESSHCYRSMEAFLAEVRRVLRPGGTFHFADLRTVEGAQRLQDELLGCGLTILRQTDITANVLEALSQDHERKLNLIKAMIPRAVQRPFRHFAGLQGTVNYAVFESGRLTYLSAVLVKDPPVG